MMMSGGITSCCVALLLTLTSVSAVKRALNSINHLKSIEFGETVPKRSLLLLHWFANEIDIDADGVMRLTFDADSGAYGSHHYYYGSYTSVLDPPPPGSQDYTLGNIHQDGPPDLPDHVVQVDDDKNNMARIIFRVREQIIDQVYISQHYETFEDTAYDPEHTYPVTTCLLRAIRKFSLKGNNINTLTSLRDHFRSSIDDSELWEMINTLGDLACLGLFFLLVTGETYSPPQRNNGRQHAARRNTQRDPMVIAPQSRKNAASDDIILKVTTDKSGKAKIIWRNVPRDFLNQGVMVALYKNNQGENALTYTSIGSKESGSYSTSEPLIEGLQVRLHEERKLFFFWKRIGGEKCRGSEFKNPEVSITGYDASLQLFVKEGKACARLRVKKSFRNWRSEFKKAWVGFYSSGDKAIKSYAWWKWQWATKFKERKDFQNSTHDEYEYESSMVIAAGVQIRFILRDEIERARTPAWD